MSVHILRDSLALACLTIGANLAFGSEIPDSDVIEAITMTVTSATAPFFELLIGEILNFVLF